MIDKTKSLEQQKEAEWVSKGAYVVGVSSDKKLVRMPIITINMKQ